MSSDLRARLLELVKETGAFLQGEFMLSSGKTSPYYFDGKKIMLHSEGLYLVSLLMLREMASWKPDGVSGKSVGADPLIAGVTLLSHLEKMPLRGFLVRSVPKQHGTEQQLEGGEVKGLHIVLLDDVLTTGRSLLFAAEKLREAGAKVVRAIVILDRAEGGTEQLSQEGITSVSLFSLVDLLQ